MKRILIVVTAAVILLLWATSHTFATDCYGAQAVRSYTPAIAWSPPVAVVANGTATYNYRQSEEWERNQAEINQLRGALQILQAMGMAPQTDGGESVQPQEQMRPGQGPLPQPAGPPAAPMPAPAANGKYPLLMAKCANCHGTANPAGDFFINPSESFEGDDNAWKIVKILKKTYNGKMPVDKDGNPHPLTNEEYAELEHEFLADPE